MWRMTCERKRQGAGATCSFFSPKLCPLQGHGAPQCPAAEMGSCPSIKELLNPSGVKFPLVCLCLFIYLFFNLLLEQPAASDYAPPPYSSLSAPPGSPSPCPGTINRPGLFHFPWREPRRVTPARGGISNLCDVPHLRSLALPKLSEPFLVARRRAALRMHHQEARVKLECSRSFQQCRLPRSIWLPPNGKIVCRDESQGPKL